LKKTGRRGDWVELGVRFERESDRMTITLNGEIRELTTEVTLDRLLELFSLPSQRVAVELNREVIRRKDWEITTIKADDRIEIVHFVGGG
jgi:thiamine biosynthesis protein ThiS